MTTKRDFWHYDYFLIIASVLLLSNCKKEVEINVPLISTAEVIEITQTSAVSGGTITNDRGSTVTARGVCWSTNHEPTINDSKTKDGSDAGSYKSYIYGLEPKTTYYIRAYANNSVGTGYGDAISFTTLETTDLPTLTTIEITCVTDTSAVSGGNIINDGGTSITARGIVWSTSENPTLESNEGLTSDGEGLGEFTSQLSNLTKATTYYIRAFASNHYGTSYGNEFCFSTYYGFVTDIDGNKYGIVLIGDQEWMAENLRTTKYNDGTPIPTGHANSEWATLWTGAYAIYPHTGGDWPDEPVVGINSDEEMLVAYGALYNWYAVNTLNLCPIGWRVPTDLEWTILINYAGGESVAASKLKSIRTAPDAHPRWESPNTGATDEYSFSALPGGYRKYNDGAFYGLGKWGYWWSSTEIYELAWYRAMYNSGYVERSNYFKWFGFSVRCVRDNVRTDDE